MGLLPIDLGSAANAGDGELTYLAWVKQTTMNAEIYSLLASVGNVTIIERPISLLGLPDGLNELQQVAQATNALNPGFICQVGQLPVVSYYKPYNPFILTPFFRKTYYALKTGSGQYGVGGNITVSSSDIIKLGEVVNEPTTVISLGEIGATPISTIVNASPTELIVDGFTEFQATNNGEQLRYIFNGENGGYGANWNQTAAGNFIDVNEDATLNIVADTRGKNGNKKSTDFTIGSQQLFLTTTVTQEDATITIPADATEDLPVGTWGQLYFEGAGNHTVSYPETDGASQLQVSAGNLVYFEKQAADKWIVRVIGATNAATTIKLAQVDLTATQLHTGNSAEIEIVPARPGFMRRVLDADLDVTHNGTSLDYTGNGYAYIKQAGRPNSEAMLALNASSSNLNAGASWHEAIPDWIKKGLTEAAAINFATDSDTATTNGDTTAKVTVMYIEYKR